MSSDFTHTTVSGSALALARATLGVTQRELAAALGVTREAEAGWERGHVPAKRVAAVTDLLGPHRLRWAMDSVSGITTETWAERVERLTDDEVNREQSVVGQVAGYDRAAIRGLFEASNLFPQRSETTGPRPTSMAVALGDATDAELLAEIARRLAR